MEVNPTHWTPEQGPARNWRERLSHHVWVFRVRWYIAVVTSMSIGILIGTPR